MVVVDTFHMDLEDNRVMLEAAADMVEEDNLKMGGMVEGDKQQMAEGDHMQRVDTLK